MRYLGRARLAGMAVVAVWTSAACRQEPPPKPQPPPAQPPPVPCSQPQQVRPVPLNVIRVLDNQDTPGAQTNKGCRLTDEQIRQYIAQAQTVYMANCKINLTWDSQIQDYRRNLNDYVHPARNGRTFEWFLTNDPQDKQHNHYDSAKLNLFFHGNLKFDTNGDMYGDTSFNANTIDPGDAAAWGSYWIDQHILLNDRGGNNGQGRFVSQDGVLEHELAHWFLRQRASQGGRYDANEHAGTAQLLLRTTTPHPLVFNENPAAGICERYEIWNKAATWNNP
jgi:hypothetical protein